MSRTKRRRQNKLSEYLTKLSRDNKEKFLQEWNKRLASWGEEARRRGISLRRGDHISSSEEWVFEVLEQAENLIAMCGKRVEELVGAETRRTLLGECCRGLAIAFGPELYQMSNQRGYYLMTVLGTHNPSRRSRPSLD